MSLRVSKHAAAQTSRQSQKVSPPAFAKDIAPVREFIRRWSSPEPLRQVRAANHHAIEIRNSNKNCASNFCMFSARFMFSSERAKLCLGWLVAGSSLERMTPFFHFGERVAVATARNERGESPLRERKSRKVVAQQIAAENFLTDKHRE